ncbi:hypothetical protein ONE63_001018 [Megalurothrips usitatus]|uniref:Uncharacterized protein n=1 Tax=Megalurothrips usitatus TaxID=439358 RepID=A0AAV7XAV9_9NEOP|nr:hypothetical protein ONE63_001018 [Megalurothrips usitatus]
MFQSRKMNFMLQQQTLTSSVSPMTPLKNDSLSSLKSPSLDDEKINSVKRKTSWEGDSSDKRLRMMTHHTRKFGLQPTLHTREFGLQLTFHTKKVRTSADLPEKKVEASDDPVKNVNLSTKTSADQVKTADKVALLILDALKEKMKLRTDGSPASICLRCLICIL